MATCANCVNDALYTYRVTDDFGIDYCQYHLPRFLIDHKNSGLLEVIPAQVAIPEIEETSEPEAVAEEPVKTTKKKAVAKETPEEDAPAEEPEADASN